MQFKTKLGLVNIPNPEVLSAADSIRGSDRPDREKLGQLAWETYRTSIQRTTDEKETDWSGLDHERQLAFRDLAEAIWARGKNETSWLADGVRPAHGARMNYMNPPTELWVRWSEDGRTIIGQWDFEPFPTQMCKKMNIVRYVAAKPE
jgi:hypothetical protein